MEEATQEMHGNVDAAQISDQGRLLSNDRVQKEETTQRAQGHQLKNRQFFAERSDGTGKEQIAAQRDHHPEGQARARAAAPVHGIPDNIRSSTAIRTYVESFTCSK